MLSPTKISPHNIMETNKSCSLEHKKEMKNGMSIVLKMLSDKTFVPEKKYEKV